VPKQQQPQSAHQHNRGLGNGGGINDHTHPARTVGGVAGVAEPDCFVLALQSIALPAFVEKQIPKTPNFLIIMVDDMDCSDIGCLGDELVLRVTPVEELAGLSGRVGGWS